MRDTPVKLVETKQKWHLPVRCAKKRVRSTAILLDVFQKKECPCSMQSRFLMMLRHFFRCFFFIFRHDIKNMDIFWIFLFPAGILKTISTTTLTAEQTNLFVNNVAQHDLSVTEEGCTHVYWIFIVILAFSNEIFSCQLSAVTSSPGLFCWKKWNGPAITHTHSHIIETPKHVACGTSIWCSKSTFRNSISNYTETHSTKQTCTWTWAHDKGVTKNTQYLYFIAILS